MKKRARAIHAELRKESKTFDGWLKYEITIEHLDRRQEKIPAYGKDLQDALSRVAHDKKVERVVKTKLPLLTALFMIGLITSAFAAIALNIDALGIFIGPVIIATMVILAALTISIANWFNFKNRIT
jgi:hypothetical protein